VALDGNLIRENRLSVLTLDERWNSLFRCAEKTPAIARGEEILNGCIKEQARLTAELGECRTRKKLLLGRIVELTRHAFNRGGESAKREISECEAQIRAIKAREPEIDERLSMLRNDIKNANMELLETAAGHVYQDIFDSRRQLDLLDGEIAGLSERLGARTAEREVLAKSSAEAYAGLLDLLGAEQMDELEKYFSG
jgi:chromosome segregation ATPase